LSHSRNPKQCKPENEQLRHSSVGLDDGVVARAVDAEIETPEIVVVGGRLLLNAK
jgi:hypothetical protein